VLAGGKLLQINTLSNQVVASIAEAGATMFGTIGVGEGAVWVPRGDIFSPGLKRIDVTTLQVVATIPVVTNHIAVGHGSVWATSMKKGTLSRIDPRTNQVIATMAVGKSPTFVAADEHAIWVLNNDDGTVSRIDPNTNQVVATIKFGPGTSIWKTLLSQYPAAYFGFAAGAGAVWVTAFNHGVVLRIDPDSNEMARAVPVGRKPSLIAVCGSTVWVETDSVLLKIDPKTDRVVETIQLLGTPGQRKMAAMACSQDVVWAIPGPIVGDRVERINFRP
jgi:YVTN family beta-propeller protein